jgi:hypothetical protein
MAKVMFFIFIVFSGGITLPECMAIDVLLIFVRFPVLRIVEGITIDVLHLLRVVSKTAMMIPT